MANGRVDEPWMQDVRTKVITIFVNREEMMLRILFYLDAEEDRYKNQTTSPPAWKTLRTALFNDHVFMKYAEELVQRTLTTQENATFEGSLVNLNMQLLRKCDKPWDPNQCQGFQLAKYVTDNRLLWESGTLQLAKVWGNLPVETQERIIQTISEIVVSRVLSLVPVANVVSRMTGLVTSTSGMIALAAVLLTVEAFIAIQKWYKGEISGIRCTKTIVDSAVTIGGGFASGAAAGAVVGSVGGPVGVVIGGLLGMVVGAALAGAISDRLTQWLFDLPKSVALENAYQFLNVKPSSSNEEINRSYRELCLIYHPDKGGNAEDFQLLHSSFGLIKISREDN